MAARVQGNTRSFVELSLVAVGAEGETGGARDKYKSNIIPALRRRSASNTNIEYVGTTG